MHQLLDNDNEIEKAINLSIIIFIDYIKMWKLIELQHKLMEARGELPSEPKYKVRLAQAQNVSNLIKSGMFTDNEISYFLGAPRSVIQNEKATIAEDQEARRKFLRGFPTTVVPEGEGGYFAICQK